MGLGEAMAATPLLNQELLGMLLEVRRKKNESHVMASAAITRQEQDESRAASSGIAVCQGI